MACPACGRQTGRVHAYHVRRLADLPVGGRGVHHEVRVRRLTCRNVEAIRQGAAGAVQVSDQWQLWHGLAAAVGKTVIAHSDCWHAGPPRQTRARQQRRPPSPRRLAAWLMT
ncbi:transposase family protein [Dactylosporangium maewongense]|uniref:transposase family protein n=1 Tax=Dactylosporangium maewongense TaxID=634393 RepID=UPI0031D3F3E7